MTTSEAWKTCDVCGDLPIDSTWIDMVAGQKLPAAFNVLETSGDLYRCPGCGSFLEFRTETDQDHYLAVTGELFRISREAALEKLRRLARLGQGGPLAEQWIADLDG